MVCIPVDDPHGEQEAHQTGRLSARRAMGRVTSIQRRSPTEAGAVQEILIVDWASFMFIRMSGGAIVCCGFRFLRVKSNFPH